MTNCRSAKRRTSSTGFTSAEATSHRDRTRQRTHEQQKQDVTAVPVMGRAFLEQNFQASEAEHDQQE